MTDYLAWLEFAETQYQKSLVPGPGDTPESHAREKMFWKGYLGAARDAARYMQKER